MGLDITAYSRLDYIGHGADDEHDDENCCYDSGWNVLHIHAFAYAAFIHALDGIPGSPDIRKETWGSTDVLDAGYFQPTEATETHAFRAGSYHGYNEWRRALRSCFNPEQDTDLPFFELIYFADNEGSILWKSAHELSADFEENRERWRDYCVEQYSGPDQIWFLEKYEDWAHAFKLAADGGLVDFH